MNIKKALIILIFILICRSQIQCGPKVCSVGQICVTGNRCFTTLKPILSPIPLIPLNLKPIYQSSQNCPNLPCPNSQICIQRRCVDPRIGVRIPATTPAKLGVIDQTSTPYAMYYCDENVYHLCGLFDRVRKDGWQGYAVILSNNMHSIRLRMQRLGESALNGYRTVWNYHVIFIAKAGRQEVKVFDFDSRLDWGVNFFEAWNKTFVTQVGEPTTLYRVVSCPNYLKYFSSTRSGMIKGQIGGRLLYRHPPPTDYLINNRVGQINTLSKFVDFTFYDLEYGTIMNPREFYQFMAK